MKFHKPYCIIVITTLAFSCAGAEIAIRDELKNSASKIILLGEMENRVLDFNPFVVKNFSDAIAFEFFSRGYIVKRAAASGSIAELLTSNGADLFISGSIFEARFGDAIEDRTSTAIQLLLYGKNGTLSGSCRIITDDTLSDAEAVRSIASKLASAIHNAVRQK